MARPQHLDERKYYQFGLRLGLANVLRNGFRLGLKKTAGKLLQPVNSYTRFPEYWFLGSEAERYLGTSGSAGRRKILDVSSPKCFSLYLAYHFDAELYMTDIDDASVMEAEILWRAIRDRAKGATHFSVEDARSLTYADETFDIVYSMSVIEHVAGSAGDSESVREMLRVLKPGGLLMVTVPFGPDYVEQGRAGFEGAARGTGDKKVYFFQRIYAPESARERIIGAIPEARLVKAFSVSAKDSRVARLYRQIGGELRGLCGGLNPILSAALNRYQEGIVPVEGNYGAQHRPTDVYGDLMLAWRKEPVGAQ